MATARLENRAEALQRSSDRLWKRYEQGEPLQADEFEALAEVSFRLAVHPQTETATAFKLLYRAHKLDGTNPKYAYHLGRLYLVHGEIDRAAEWLTTAAQLCPTSHRIWSHLSIVQRTLHERYQRQSEYESDALRERAEQIASAVRDGTDSIPFSLADVDPPPSRASLDAQAAQRIEEIRQEQGDRRAAEIQREAERLAHEEARRAGTTMRSVGMKHLSQAEAALRQQRPLADENGAQPRLAEIARGGPATVPRVTNPGTCRWLGIYDLEVDVKFGAETSPSDELLCEIEKIQRIAAERSRGGGAFAVLAIEWLVCGYSPRTIRRLSERLPPSERAVREFLDRVCELFEADRADLPQRLAECLEREELPPMLVALIHHRRLLWRPLTFPDLGAYRAAKGYLANPPTDVGKADNASAGKHVAALEAVIRTLRRPAAKPISEPGSAARSVIPEAGEAGPPTGLVALDRGAGELGARLDEAWARLMKIEERVKSGEPTPGDAAACDEIAAFVDEAEQNTKEALAALSRLRESGQVENPEKLAELEAAYKQFNTRPAPFRRKRNKLMSSLSADSDTAAAEAVSSTGGSGTDRVAGALQRAEQAMDENFALAWETFDAYNAAQMRSGPVAALRTFVAGRQADTLYRMGRTREAKRIWHWLLTVDRLNVAALKNLAVAHTSGGDIAQAAQAWQSYLEALYFLDVVAGSPRPRAEERAQVHNVCAAAYGTGSLLGGPPRGDEDLSDVPDFLSRRASVAALADHRRLEGLNRWLGYRSPILVLGVSRSNDEESLKRARDRQLAFVRDACLLLPSRIREAFRDLSVAHVELAYRDSLDVKRRTLERERYYKNEERTYLEWIKETIIFKIRIRNAIHDHTDWAFGRASGDVIGNLAHIDAIRLDPADDLVCRTAESLGSSHPKDYLEQLNNLVDLACNVGLNRIFGEATAADDDSFVARFRSTAESWAQNAIPDEYVDALDDPQRLYGPSVAPAFEAVGASGGALDSRARRLAEDAVATLQRWTRKLPGTTGPARLLAQLLVAVGRLDEASTVLEQSRADGFSDRGRLACAELLAPIAVQRGDVEGGLGLVRELIGRTPGSRSLLVVLHNAYTVWLNVPGREGPAPTAIAADFDRWLAGVDAGDSTAELRAQAVAFRRTLIVQATIVACRDRAGAVDWRRLVRELRALRAEDTENQDALYYEMQALQNGLVAVNRELSSATGPRRRELDTESRRLLDELRATAEALVQVSSDAEQRTQAESLLEGLRRHGGN